MDALDTFLDALADRLAARMSAVVPTKDSGDPLLTAKEGATRLRMSPGKFRRLVNAGLIKRAKGFDEIRVRQSVIDDYGK